jgi:hypothetical protein
MVIVFKNPTIANSWMQEIGVTPSGVWLWMEGYKPNGSDFERLVGDPSGTPNVVTYAQDANGLCAIEHPFSPEDVAFFTEYMAEAISSRDVRLITDSKLPLDWVWRDDI